MRQHASFPAAGALIPEQDSACAREPIHIPGSIQPHGALLAVRKTGLISHASANLLAILGHDAAAVLGHPLADIFGAEMSRVVMEAADRPSSNGVIEMLTGADGRLLKLRAHQTGARICLDIEPISRDPQRVSAMIRLQSIRESFTGAASCVELCELAVAGLKQATGYDRVVAYRLATEGHGEVIAEAVDPALPRYLGLHYPAGDIPAQARRLFLRQRVAAIADSNYTPVPILCDPALDDGTPLDLTHSGLRSVSPLHREYMRNMQTAASLTVALVDEGQLWGMLVCHHSRPMVAEPELRALADAIGEIVSSRLRTLEEAEFAADLAARAATLEALRLRLTAPLPFVEALMGAQDDLLRLVGATGAVIRHAGEVVCIGDTPSLDAAERALDVLQPELRSNLFAVNDLGLRYPDLAACTMRGSGALLLSLPSAPDDAILWFRPEVSRTVLWAGASAPHDNPALQNKRRQSPKSSVTWKEISSGQANPWTQADLQLAGELRGIIERETGQHARMELARLRVALTASGTSPILPPVDPPSRPAFPDGLQLLLFDAAPDAMVVADGAGNIRLFNLQAEKEFGYRGEELIGQPIDMLIPGLFGQKDSLNWQHPVADSRIGMTGGGTERLGRRKDGSEFPAEIALSDFATAEGLLVTAAIRNISVRKNAETQMARIDRQNRDLLEASPDVMVMFKANGEIVLLNRQADAQFGYPRHELAGRSIETIIPHGIMTHAANIAARTKANPAGTIVSTPFELEGVRKDQTRFPIEITLGMAGSGEALFFTAAIRDITIHKELESFMLSKLEELKRSNKELEQFAMIASHDLQEPLRMVTSYTQLLARRYKGKLDADADDFITFAVDGALRMQQLIRDLLAYCRVETTAAPLVAVPCAEPLRMALSNLLQLIETSGAVITAGPLPDVMADIPQLSRVFQNLIVNSINYRSEAPPAVHVSAEWVESGKWLISVHDNGIGIEPQYFERIFGMFKRLHPRDESSGTGIGLAICKKIIEHHQGTISVRSNPGEGSVFQFTLLPAMAKP